MAGHIGVWAKLICERLRGCGSSSLIGTFTSQGSGHCLVMYEFTSGILTINPAVGKVQRAFDLLAHLRHLQPLIVVFSSYAFLPRLPYAVPELASVCSQLISIVYCLSSTA